LHAEQLDAIAVELAAFRRSKHGPNAEVFSSNDIYLVVERLHWNTTLSHWSISTARGSESYQSGRYGRIITDFAEFAQNQRNPRNWRPNFFERHMNSPVRALIEKDPAQYGWLKHCVTLDCTDEKVQV
jgi:hypothetical protein